MKKFKLTWTERVCDYDGDMLYLEEKSQVIEAESEDAACDIWEKENEWNDDQNGLSDCIEIIEHALFKKRLIVDMPDGLAYAVPVEMIARHRAESYMDEYDDDIAKSLQDDTIPYFELNDFNIRDWASNNMDWDEVKRSALVLTKKIPLDEFQDAWINGEWSVK